MVTWAIRTEGLTKRFGQVVALDGLDLKVGRGEIFGFLGPNGAGKSTTIRLLLALIRPTAAGHGSWTCPSGTSSGRTTTWATSPVTSRSGRS